MTKPPPGADRRAGYIADSFEDCSALHKPTQRHPQACPADTMARLLLYRFDLNVWHQTGRRGPMPQPGEYGLRLPPHEPEAVLW